MLLVSHKVVFILNETVFLCVTMRECAMTFAATIQCVTFWYSFCHYKVQFLWCTFQMNFGIGKRHFQKVVLRMNCSSPYNLLFAILLILGCENMFSVVSLLKSNFFTHFALVSQSRRSCSNFVALVSHSCRSALALVL